MGACEPKKGLWNLTAQGRFCMYVYVYMYVYMCVYMYVHMYV